VLLLYHLWLFQYADNVNVLWRLAKASHVMGTVYEAEGNNDKKKEFVLQGLFMVCGNIVMFIMFWNSEYLIVISHIRS
jgi:hypothetical protein